MSKQEKNLCGKTRPITDPYEIWKSFDGTWEWKVLKKYQKPSRELKNRFARWFCAVSSPYTHGSYELGDVYVHEIASSAERHFPDIDDPPTEISVDPWSLARLLVNE